MADARIPSGSLLDARRDDAGLTPSGRVAVRIFAGRRERRAFVNDLVWAFLLFPSIALLVGTGRATVGSLILLGSRRICCGGRGDPPGPRAPFPEDDPELAQRTADSRSPIPGEFAVSGGTSQLTVYLVGGIAALSQAAALRAGLLLLGPLNDISMGAGRSQCPSDEFVPASPGAFRRGDVLLSRGLATLVIAWGAVALLLPESLGTALLGQNWEGARNVVLPLTIVTATSRRLRRRDGWIAGPSSCSAKSQGKEHRRGPHRLGRCDRRSAGRRAWGCLGIRPARVRRVVRPVAAFHEGNGRTPGTKRMALEGRQRPWNRRRGRPPSGGEE